MCLSIIHFLILKHGKKKKVFLHTNTRQIRWDVVQGLFERQEFKPTNSIDIEKLKKLRNKVILMQYD